MARMIVTVWLLLGLVLPTLLTATPVGFLPTGKFKPHPEKKSSGVGAQQGDRVDDVTTEAPKARNIEGNSSNKDEAAPFRDQKPKTASTTHITGGVESDLQMKQTQDGSTEYVPNDAILQYLLPERDDEDWKEDREQPRIILDFNAFYLSPVAMADYLMITGDFKGFDQALEDIISVGMMTSEEAYIYRATVGLEYDSLIRQELDDYQKSVALVVPAVPEEMMHNSVRPFIPPPGIEYSDNSYYDIPITEGTEEQGNLRTLGDEIELKSVLLSSPSSSSSAQSLQDHLKFLPVAEESEPAKDEGPEKGESGILPIKAESELKLLAKQIGRNKTKEDNGTKWRRPQQKQQTRKSSETIMIEQKTNEKASNYSRIN